MLHAYGNHIWFPVCQLNRKPGFELHPGLSGYVAKEKEINAYLI
jgi:hypothetical protein